MQILFKPGEAQFPNWDFLYGSFCFVYIWVTAQFSGFLNYQDFSLFCGLSVLPQICSMSDLFEALLQWIIPLPNNCLGMFISISRVEAVRVIMWEIYIQGWLWLRFQFYVHLRFCSLGYSLIENWVTLLLGDFTHILLDMPQCFTSLEKIPRPGWFLAYSANLLGLDLYSKKPPGFV